MRRSLNFDNLKVETNSLLVYVHKSIVDITSYLNFFKVDILFGKAYLIRDLKKVFLEKLFSKNYKIKWCS
jgi:hypothetical protein